MCIDQRLIAMFQSDVRGINVHSTCTTIMYLVYQTFQTTGCGQTKSNTLERVTFGFVKFYEILDITFFEIEEICEPLGNFRLTMISQFVTLSGSTTEIPSISTILAKISINSVTGSIGGTTGEMIGIS